MTDYSSSELGRRYAEFVAAHELRSVDVDGVPLSYLDAGRGDPLLFLPGGTGSALGAFVFVEGLQDRYRVVVPTYPKVETMDDVVAAVTRLLDGADVAGAHVWGHAFGGTVAQRFLYAHPDRVRDVVLSEATVPTDERRARAEKQLRTFSRMARFMARRMLPLAFRRTLGGDDRDEQRFWEAFLAEHFVADAKATVVNLARLAVDFYRTELPEIDARWDGKMLVIESDADESYETMRAPLRERYPEADFQTFSDARATTPSRMSERYVATVLEFLG